MDLCQGGYAEDEGRLDRVRYRNVEEGAGWDVRE